MNDLNTKIKFSDFYKYLKTQIKIAVYSELNTRSFLTDTELLHLIEYVKTENLENTSKNYE